jgi:hypothetical protein
MIFQTWTHKVSTALKVEGFFMLGTGLANLPMLQNVGW